MVYILGLVVKSVLVIHTQQKVYEQPTLQDYQQCQSDLDQCLKICQTTIDPQSCGTECPVCPLLFSHDIVVQGVNDTDYSLPPQSALNYTNVIKLTNEIRNAIEINMYNITARTSNKNRVHSSSASTIGGRFGLGYNQSGSCCIVMLSTKRCQVARVPAVASCRHKQMRICSERCTQRVMYAQPRTYCKGTNGINCSTRIDYVPSHIRRSSRCQYQPTWPFVSCGYQATSNLCLHCLRLPYGFILYSGMPSHCISCFQSSALYGPGLGSINIYGQSNMIWDNEFSSNGMGNDWRITTMKCRSGDSSIYNCLEDLELSKNYQQDGDDEGDVDKITTNTQVIDDNYLNYIGTERLRRHFHPVFYRSRYSRRNKSGF